MYTVKVTLIALILTLHADEVAEWLRRWTANPLGSPRVGSNPILVDIYFIEFQKSPPSLLNKCFDLFAIAVG